MKNGSFVLDAHTGFWDASKENCKNRFGEALGLEPGEYTVYDFEVETSTHYGRQVRLDDRVLLFANPEDAAEYLGFAEAKK